MKPNNAVGSRSPRPVWHRARLWPFPIAALLLLVRCGVSRCPEGTAARYDQCVRFSDDRDGGADASHEAELESGDARADAAEAAPDACGDDRIWSGERCVLKEVFVDGRDGDDANEGTQQQPLRTFKQAMRIAVDGQVVSFEGLEYTTDKGDDFTVPIPNGVTLRTRPGSLVNANLTGDGVQALTFAGSATVERLALMRFASITASSGQQRLTGVAFDAAIISGDAEMHCEHCSAVSFRRSTDPPRIRPAIELRDRAKLTFVSGTAHEFTEAQDLVCRREGTELIRVTGAADLTIDASTLRGDGEHLVYLETQGSVKIISSNVGSSCWGGVGALAWRQLQSPSPTSTLDIEDSILSGSVTGTGNMQRVRVRRSQVSSFVIASLAPATYDFGIPDEDGGPEAGENTFSGLSVSGSDITVFASGNTWLANVQGADADGHYPVGDSRMVTGGERIEGSNFDLTSEGGPVQLLF